MQYQSDEPDTSGQPVNPGCNHPEKLNLKIYFAVLNQNGDLLSDELQIFPATVPQIAGNNTD